MAYSEEALRTRLARLEARLQRLEIHTGLRPIETGSAGIPEPSGEPAPAAAATPSTDQSPAPVDLAPMIPPAAERAGPGEFIPPRALPREPRRAATAIGSDEDGPSLERLIGGRWYAMAGGLVVIIGVAFFYQYAVQQGWFRLMPDWFKCVAGAAFGAALLAAAEVIRPRINSWAAVGLSIAGIGSMYVSTYAAYARYSLIGITPAFILLTACAGVGILFAARARLVAVALLSLIGGYLTPFLLRGAERSFILPPYWSMLLVVGLALSAGLDGSFRMVRWLTAWATLLFGAAWVLEEGPKYPYLAIGFIAFTWAALHAELWWSSARPANRWFVRGVPDPLREWSPAMMTFIVTVWAAAVGIAHARAWGQVPDWLPPASGAVITAMLSFILAGNLRLLRDAPATNPERLGAGLCAQAGGLLITAVALALSGWLEVVAWLAMGLAGVLAGRWIDSRPLRAYGALLLAIATARLLFYDSVMGRMAAGPADAFHGLVLSRWMLLMMIAATAWAAAAVLAAIDSPALDDSASPPVSKVRRPIPPAAFTAIGIALLMASFVHAQASATSITIAWMGLAAILIPLTPGLRSVGLARVAARLHLSAIAAGPALVAIIPWSVAFLAHGWSAFSDPPGLHRGLVIAILLALELAWIAWTLAPSPGPDAIEAGPDAEDRRAIIRGSALGLGAILVFIATTFEASRVAGLLFTDRTSQLAAVSIWWGLFSIALLVIGFLPPVVGRAAPDTPRHTLGKIPRQAGLALLGLATAKALFIDTAQVSLGWRVISVLGLGLLMLSVGIVYARLAGREKAAAP